MTEIQPTLRTLSRLVGCTPLLAVDVRFRGQARRIYAKAESFNFTGSIKDRMALHVLRRAHESGALKPGAPIAEATSGNTGISFSALGRALGHPVTIFMPDWMSQERKDLIRSFGAQIRLVSAAEGGFLGSIRLSEVWAAETPDAYLPCQFANEVNVEAHATTTGPEIWAQLASAGLRPDAFVAGVGTGGTVMGVGRFLKGMDSGIRIHPVEPSNSPTLHTGHKIGKHRIQGISDEFIPSIVKLDQLDDILSVDDGDAILMAQKLADRGLGVGISSGANFLAALEAQERLGPEAVVATVFSDSNKKYLSTDLMKVEPLKPGFLSPEVELIGIGQAIRVCEVCLQGEGKVRDCGC
ncbi:cysteine synthase [Geothrix oryzae]|uniref:Cysteine synthase n=1 Tax=Geothrix oryzae TaxID=2927975 RepID=A0ABN6V040_9BACT|nr:cysteine synthase family protein [Geothrix oryzae]BDU69645.1 cysteine synthase [Geothrix oryzae]